MGQTLQSCCCAERCDQISALSKKQKLESKLTAQKNSVDAINIRQNKDLGSSEISMANARELANFRAAVCSTALLMMQSLSQHS